MRLRRSPRPSAGTVRRARVPFAAVALVLLAGAAAGCTQQDPQATTKPKASAVVPTGAATTVATTSTTTAAGATTTVALTTIEDVRSTLTADGTLDVDQADCVMGNLKGSLPDAEVVAAFNLPDLSGASAAQRGAVVKAFTACVPKEVLIRPIGLGVQQVAATKGVTVGNAEVDCIAKQLAAAVTYDDLLLAKADGSGGLPDATATAAVRACVSADAFSSLGLGG